MPYGFKILLKDASNVGTEVFQDTEMATVRVSPNDPDAFDL